MAAGEKHLRVQCHGVDDESCALWDQIPKSVYSSLFRTPADKDGVRRGQAGERLGPACLRHGNAMREAECACVGPDVSRAVGARLDGVRAGAGRREAPFDGHRPRTGAEVPQHLAGAGCQRRKRQGANRSLGDLAVMREELVGKPRRARHTDRTGRRYGHRDGVADIRQVEPPGNHGPQPFLRATQRFENGEAGGAEALVGQPAGELPAAAASRRRQMACTPRASTGTSRSKGAACKARQSVSSSRQPSRAAAREKVDGAGWQVHSPGCRRAARLPPAPNQNGSPEARTTTLRPASARTGSIPNGMGHSRPRSPAPARARCRGAPKTISAAASAARLASDNPASPSSPSPMIVSQGSAMTRVLLLGGTTEASQLARALAAAGIDAVFSYAGRTGAPVEQPLPTRIGGFGGPEGLVRCLREEGITHVVDATHPFAARMSRNAVEACGTANVPLCASDRAPWAAGPGDDWRHVPDIAGAVAALPDAPAPVFLAIGRQNLEPFTAKPQHRYLLRL